MATLYIRDVPESVSEVLKRRAAAEGKSLSTYVAGELTNLAQRPTNAEVVARLAERDRSSGPSTDEILAALDEGRR
ncbi:FitA-like ribbon-helix-helix domain-containing protein [Pseudactinotalea sp.]|uniref:FitA-like ribbon-helix-helix domain-containing protein n=1 Tax=Pseudactinotalea sp. TaxID=1926260 RepID=UPI003B3AC3BC